MARRRRPLPHDYDVIRLLIALPEELLADEAMLAAYAHEYPESDLVAWIEQFGDDPEQYAELIEKWDQWRRAELKRRGLPHSPAELIAQRRDARRARQLPRSDNGIY